MKSWPKLHWRVRLRLDVDVCWVLTERRQGTLNACAVERHHFQLRAIESTLPWYLDKREPSIDNKRRARPARCQARMPFNHAYCVRKSASKQKPHDPGYLNGSKISSRLACVPKSAVKYSSILRLHLDHDNLHADLFIEYGVVGKKIQTLKWGFL